MAMSVTLTQPLPAQMGAPCTFVAAVANSSGANVTLNAIQPVVNRPDGGLVPGVTVGQVIAEPASNTAQVGGYQFNVVIPATSTVYFTFQIVFPAQAIAGGPVSSVLAYVVSVNCVSSDGSAFSIQAPVTQLNQPQFGQPPGRPPNADNGPRGQTGITEFQNPANAVLAL